MKIWALIVTKFAANKESSAWKYNVFPRRPREAGRSLISTHLQPHLDAPSLSAADAFLSQSCGRTLRRRVGVWKKCGVRVNSAIYFNFGRTQWKYDAVCGARAFAAHAMVDLSKFTWWVYDKLRGASHAGSSNALEIRMDRQNSSFSCTKFGIYVTRTFHLLIVSNHTVFDFCRQCKKQNVENFIQQATQAPLSSKLLSY